MTEREWKLSRRTLVYGPRTLVMGVLNVTPDSFSDGGLFSDPRRAAGRARELVEEGADIIDVGGESTRPGGEPVGVEEEIRRVVPVVEALAGNIAAPVSVDTSKAEVARAALGAGAEIVNDISALRFDPALADEAARAGAGLVLMHSRGTLETLHSLEPVADIMCEVLESLRRSLGEARRRGVARESLALDPGIGFGKSQGQNVELVARLSALAEGFPDFPLLVGTSRKSFIGRLLGGAPVGERLHGTMATVTAAVQTVRVADALKAASLEP